MFQSLKRDRDFYKMVLAIAVPIMVQNGITNFVSLLDNLMVGQVGTQQMSGVAIANQLIFVFNLTIFGGLAGAGIFGAQFYGKGDYEGVKHTLRFKMYLAMGLCLVAMGIFLFAGKPLIGLYLTSKDSPEAVAATLNYGHQYLMIMLVGMVPYAITQVYANTLRECGETMLPMKAGIIAILVNLVFNYFLIFGHFGFPKLGIAGAAIATVLSRFVELATIFVVVHLNKTVFPFLVHIFDSFKIDSTLAKQIAIKGAPLLANEALWSIGVAMLNQCYSTRGLDVVAATNISSTVSNLFNVVFLALGNALAIIIGQELGANKIEQAIKDDRKILFFSTGICIALSIALAIASPFIPQLYNTTSQVKQLATQLILVCAVCTPLFGFTSCCYFTLRCGGKTFITFLFDSMFVWVVNIPVAFLLTHFTGIYVVWIYAIIQGTDLIKSIYGYIMVNKKIWVNNIVESQNV